VTLTLDTSDVRRLAARLTEISAAAVPALAVVVRQTAVAVRDDLRRDARGHRRFKAFPSSITEDVRGLWAEIGPDKNRRQGALGNLLYFGTARSGPTLEHPEAALARAIPGFEAAVAYVAAQALTDGPITAPPPAPRKRNSKGQFA
jgi:hypothetical protein